MITGTYIVLTAAYRGLYLLEWYDFCIFFAKLIEAGSGIPINLGPPAKISFSN